MKIALSPQARIIALNGLLCIAIVLQLDKTRQELSLGLLVIWLGLMFTRGLIANRQKENAQTPTLLYGSALGLTMIQAGTITQQNDEQGITQLLLVCAGLLAGSSLNIKEARSLLQWLGIAGLIISSMLLIPMLHTHNFSTGEFVNEYEYIFKKGFGDQSSLRMTLTLLISAGIAAARISKNAVVQITMMGAAIIIYIAIVATDSRMAMVAPIISFILAWLIDKWKTINQKSGRFLIITCLTAFSSCLIAAWKLIIAPDLASGMSSDSQRVSIWGCWLRSIFSGNNRFLLGFGHDATPISNICTDIAIGWPKADPLSASGHAHNTIINIISHYGILGFAAIIILGYIYIQAIFITHPKSTQKAKFGGLLASSWREACLMAGITILICAFSNTLYIKNQALSLLTGLLLSLPFASLQYPEKTNDQP